MHLSDPYAETQINSKSNANAAFTTPLNVVVAIIGISALASGFLFWLVYKHQPIDVTGTHLAFLPALNAALNGCCTVALLIGFGTSGRDASSPIATRCLPRSSSLLSSWSPTSLTTPCTANLTSSARAWSAPSISRCSSPTSRSPFWRCPMILVTFFFSLSGRIPLHRRIAQYTFPVWLYVSVTGVIVYAMLAIYR